MKKTFSICLLLMYTPMFAPGNNEQQRRNIIHEYEDEQPRCCNQQCCYVLSWAAFCYCCAVCCGPRQDPVNISRQEPPQINAFTGNLEKKKKA